MTTVTLVISRPPLVKNTARPRLSFGGVLHSEWIKALSLRSIRWSVLTSVVLGIGMSAVMALAFRSLMTGEEGEHAIYLTTIVGFPANFLALVFGVLGVFIFAGEYASGMILSTLTSVPRRGMVVGAKAAILSTIAAASAAITVVAGVVIGIAFIPQAASEIASIEVISGLLGTVLFLVAISLFSFAIAGLVRSTAGAITIVVGVTFVLPTVTQLITGLTDWSWATLVLTYLPTVLGATASQGISAAAVETPNYWQSLLALGVWAVIPMAAMVYLFYRRDAR